MTRKEAREYIIKHCNPHRDTGTQWNDAMECAIKALEEPEPKIGKWIAEDDAIIHGRCSVCGWKAIFGETDVFGMDYCPNCGERLEVEDGTAN